MSNARLFIIHVHVLIHANEIALDLRTCSTWGWNRSIRLRGKLLVDAEIKSYFFVIHVRIEIEIDRNHEEIIALIRGCDGRVLLVILSEKVLHQVISAQKGRFVVIVKNSCAFWHQLDGFVGMHLR